jgi:hypothetical protein
MNDIKKKSFYILILSNFLFLLNASAQSTVVSGIILDSKDRTPLPYVTVLFKGSRIVTKTDAGGKYTLSSPSAYSQLQVNYVGYKTQVLTISPNITQTVNIKLQETAQDLTEVKISSGKRARYRNKDNPAVELIHRVIEHKPMNRMESEKNVEFQQYDWMQFSLSNLSEKFKNKKIFRKYQFLYTLGSAFHKIITVKILRRPRSSCWLINM